MNYKKIHDNIIERAKTRKYDPSKFQNHHIIPLHEDKDSVETVPLTIKEHSLIHLLRYKMGKGKGNLVAHRYISGMDLLLNRDFGKIGGENTKNKGVGIFDKNLQHLRTEWAKIGANSLNKKGTRSGIYSKKWREENKELVKEITSNAGKKTPVGRMFWWNNGKINKKSFECPGDNWKRGMLMSEKKRKQVYNKIAGHNRKDKTCH